MQAKIVGGLLIISLIILALATLTKRSPPLSTNTPEQGATPTLAPENKQESSPLLLVEPVQDFKQRITKKPFGIYISPNNSPVSPERFTGYHTGADAEFEDITDEVRVRAIADGKVVYSGWATGYGGVISVTHQINQETVTAVYGHLKPDSLLKVGTEVRQSQVIGVLGQGYSRETDGERKHLHFGIHKGDKEGDKVNLRGYVATKEELTGWEDSQKIFN